MIKFPSILHLTTYTYASIVCSHLCSTGSDPVSSTYPSPSHIQLSLYHGNHDISCPMSIFFWRYIIHVKGNSGLSIFWVSWFQEFWVRSERVKVWLRVSGGKWPQSPQRWPQGLPTSYSCSLKPEMWKIHSRGVGGTFWSIVDFSWHDKKRSVNFAWNRVELAWEILGMLRFHLCSFDWIESEDCQAASIALQKMLYHCSFGFSDRNVVKDAEK